MNDKATGGESRHDWLEPTENCEECYGTGWTSIGDPEAHYPQSAVPCMCVYPQEVIDEALGLIYQPDQENEN